MTEPLPVIEYVDGEPEVEYVDVNSGNIPEVDFIDEESEATTKIPISVLDPSRFDIENDKVTSSIATETATTATTEPTTTTTEPTTTTTTEPTTTTTELTTTPIETTELATDPTLNIDPGLLEELKKQNMSIPDEE